MKKLFKKTEFLLIAIALLIVFAGFSKIMQSTEHTIPQPPAQTLPSGAHAVVDLIFDPFTTAANGAGTYTVTIPVHLVGRGKAELFSLYFSVNANITAIRDASAVRRVVIGHVDNTEAQSIQFKNVALPFDLNKICAWADPLGQIPETNETNNIRCETISTRPSPTPKTLPTKRVASVSATIVR